MTLPCDSRSADSDAFTCVSKHQRMLILPAGLLSPVSIKPTYQSYGAEEVDAESAYPVGCRNLACKSDRLDNGMVDGDGVNGTKRL